MTYGITGNTGKTRLWQPVADLVTWLRSRDLAFCLAPDVAEGLAERGLVAPGVCAAHADPHLHHVDVLLSFGGDGTLLHSARTAGPDGPPILGVNIGRLGFLADIEVRQVREAISAIEAGAYRIEERTVLQAEAPDDPNLPPTWALNEIVIERSGAAGLLTIRVEVDGVFLNDYWGDGLIISTPTGSTAYSLSVGGPILSPDARAIVLSPIAPHTLTARPIVLPDTAVLRLHAHSRSHPYVVAADGLSTRLDREGLAITIRRAAHSVRLVKLPEQHYFGTLRRKLMWGEGQKGWAHDD